MAEILGNELLIKALGKKGWREVKHLCVCVQEAAVQSARGNDTTTQASHYLWHCRFTPLAMEHSNIFTHIWVVLTCVCRGLTGG